MREVRGGQPLIHYVYTTARGLCRTVHAENHVMAWNLARKKHKPFKLLNLDGEGWSESSRWPGCSRDEVADLEPAHARDLYFKACLAELPTARDAMPTIVAGRYPDLSEQRLLDERGLWDGSEPGLTDLGRAFAEWIAGGAR